MTFCALNQTALPSLLKDNPLSVSPRLNKHALGKTSHTEDDVC